MVLGYTAFVGLVASAVLVGIYGHVALAALLLASGVVSGVVAFIRGNGK